MERERGLVLDAGELGGAEMMGESRLTRQEVHALLWSRPTVQVAILLGVSGGSIERSCRRRGIPVPDRGYWQRVKAGHVLARPPLEPAEVELPMPWRRTGEVDRALRELGLAVREVARATSVAPPAATATSSCQPVASSVPLASAMSNASATDEVRKTTVTKVPTFTPQPTTPWLQAKVWIDRERAHVEMANLCDSLEQIARCQPAEVRRVMLAWTAIVRKRIEDSSPVSEFVDMCTRLATEGGDRTWWPPDAAPDHSSVPSSSSGRDTRL